jgi:hypothetical protein
MSGDGGGTNGALAAPHRNAFFVNDADVSKIERDIQTDIMLRHDLSPFMAATTDAPLGVRRPQAQPRD